MASEQPTGKTSPAARPSRVDATPMAGPLMVSVGLHVAIAAIIAVSMNFTPSFEQPTLSVDLSNLDEAAVEPQVDEIVEAVAVDQAAVQQQVERIEAQRAADRRAEQQRLAELERRAEAARKAREQEQQRQRELEAQREREREQALAEQRQLEQQRQEAEAAAQAAAERRRQEEAAAAKAEQARKEAEAQRQRELEAQRKREEEARRQAEREAQLQRELAEEMATRQRARRQQMLSEIEKYTALISQTIQRNWNVDESMRGKSCELTISVARSGFVTNVTTGSGDESVCRSARNAVLKANTLPVSEDPEIYQEMSTIKLTVRPEF